MARKMLVLVVTFLLGLFLGTFPVVSNALAQGRISAGVKVVPENRLSSEEKYAVSLAAGRILRHINEARSDLRYSKTNESSHNVALAWKLIRIIENAAPSSKVTSIIKSGDLTYQDQETVKQLIIPVYPELDETNSVLLPIKRAKQEAAGRFAESSGSLSDYQAQCTSVMLDVQDAKYYLETADAALKKKDAAAADKALNTIQENVVCEYDEQEVPLVKARAELVDASRKLGQKEYKEAKEALRKASAELELFSAQTGEEAPGKARRVTKEINDLESKIDQKKGDAAEAALGLWGKVVNLP